MPMTPTWDGIAIALAGHAAAIDLILDKHCPKGSNENPGECAPRVERREEERKEHLNHRSSPLVPGCLLHAQCRLFRAFRFLSS